MASAEETAGIRGEPSRAHRGLALAAFAVLAVALGRELTVGGPAGLRDVLNSWLLPLLMAGIVLFAYGRRVEVYDSFIQGAREGFQIAVMIIPFLVAILVAVAMFRASGSLDALIALVSPITSPLGFPAEALPMALIRPLSGSGAMAVMTETMQTYGPDSFVGYLVSTMNGSTETTFYVIALYLGSVGVRSGRHAIAACLTADAVGVVAALIACRVFFG
jgi:spore maturation protein SpmB